MTHLRFSMTQNVRLRTLFTRTSITSHQRSLVRSQPLILMKRMRNCSVIDRFELGADPALGDKENKKVKGTLSASFSLFELDPEKYRKFKLAQMSTPVMAHGIRRSDPLQFSLVVFPGRAKTS